MVGIGSSKSVAIGIKGSTINIIYIIMLYQYSIVSTIISIANHCLYIFFSTVIISFIISFKGSIHHITINIDRTLPIISLRNCDTHQGDSFIIYYFNITIGKDIAVYFITVERIKKLFSQLLRVSNSCDFKMISLAYKFDILSNA